MDKDYWLSRWDKNNTGFHQAEVNNYLFDYFSLLNLQEKNRILVPLCGKTLDMLWLKKHQLNVVGAELSKKACADFFKENDLNFRVSEQDNFICYSGEDIQLFCGDFFQLTREMVGNVNAIYDRAALIALPSDYRQRYAKKIIELCSVDTKMLLISLETSKDTSSPPFNVSEENIHALYQDHFDIKKMSKFSEKTPHLIEQGYENLYSVVYFLTKKNKSDIA